jgi:hypothetical protein
MIVAFRTASIVTMAFVVFSAVLTCAITVVSSLVQLGYPVLAVLAAAVCLFGVFFVISLLAGDVK